MKTRVSGAIRHARDGAEHRVLQRLRHGEKSLALLGFGRDHVRPRDRRRRPARPASRLRTRRRRRCMSVSQKRRRSGGRSAFGPVLARAGATSAGRSARMRAADSASSPMRRRSSRAMAPASCTRALPCSSARSRSMPTGEPGDAGDDQRRPMPKLMAARDHAETHLARVEAKPRNELAEALQHGAQ